MATQENNMTMAAVGIGVGGIASGIGGKSQGDAQKSAAEKQEQMAKEQLQYQKQYDFAKGQAQNVAYGNAINNMQSGEQGIQASQGENPFLEQTTSDIATRNAKELQQGAGQMASSLASQGVRGGQASTLMNRGTGEMATNAMNNVTNLQYQDSATKQAQMNAYNQAKALLAQNQAVPGVVVGSK